MSFLRRLLSRSWRRALAAEAAGDYRAAASAYALAGDRDRVAEMHLRRAERAASRADELEALRDALVWTDRTPELRARAARALGHALLRRARDEGLARPQDQASVRDAARLLEEARDFAEAGDAWLLVEDNDAAAAAYARGGHLERMESTLARDRAVDQRERSVLEDFRAYEDAWRLGRRAEALALLRRCGERASEPGDYRRLLEEREAVALATGRALLRRRGAEALVVTCAVPTTIGRDGTCDLVLRSAGVSRVHAELVWRDGVCFLRDGGSRNGTFLDGLALDAAHGEVRLPEAGELRLGDECHLAFRTDGAALVVEVVRGLDRGARLVCLEPGRDVSLAGALGLEANLAFVDGAPQVATAPGHDLRLGGELVGRGPVQLARGDVFGVEGVEVEVA